MGAERSKGKRKECKRIKEGLELDLVIKGKSHRRMCYHTRGLVAKIGHKGRELDAWYYAVRYKRIVVCI